MNNQTTLTQLLIQLGESANLNLEFVQVGSFYPPHRNCLYPDITQPGPLDKLQE